MKIQVLNDRIQKLFMSGSYSMDITKQIETELKAIKKEKGAAISELLLFNLNNEDLTGVNAVLGFLMAAYDFEGEEEQIISLALIKILAKLTPVYRKSGNLKIETLYYLIFDIIFQNTGLIDELDLKTKEALIFEIIEISKLKYSEDKSKDSDLLMALQMIINISFYFGDEKGREILEENFMNHFDPFIIACAKDELEINQPDIF
ncbi:MULTISPECIES: hypothetical protein [Flavobacterium]|uniref:hypothetical protein n=1 Tax=Flavobacterium TaxID=237 RepID=UPI0021155AC3|nr:MULTISPECIES: hypothetical protein [Flavobacterium]UUF15852.1 hypothetical protein NLJ00_06955 [Flavobacterium panici]